LPNFQVTSIDDIQRIPKFINNNVLRQDAEIWFLKKQKGINREFASGRALFTNSFPDNQIVEMINGDSVRYLEKSDYTLYIRTERVNWGWNFQVNDIKYDTGEITDNSIISGYKKAFSQICTDIECMRERIEMFRDYLCKFGISDLSLDFLFNGTSTQIIDWDTNNDKKILNSLNSNILSDLI